MTEVQANPLSEGEEFGPIDGRMLKDYTQRLLDLLKLRTLPIGMKLFEDADEMMRLPGIRTPAKDRRFTTCQLVTQGRIHGFTLGITGTNVMPGGNCGGVIGLDLPSEAYLSGRHFEGVWFENREAARQHQAQMPRVEAGRYQGLCVSPLRTGRLDPPDICLFYATPGQMILFVNGLQHRRYRRYDFTITGETACADSWGRALKTRETSISLPCYAERRYGGVADDELLIAMPAHEYVRGIEGLAALAKAGLRYPIPPYGAQGDPGEGMAVSYGGKS